MTVLTTDSSPGGGQLMPSVVPACSCSFFTSLHAAAPEEGFWCSLLSLLLHVFASLAEKRCCLHSQITGGGVSPESLINPPRGVEGSAPRMDLACRLRRSWRSSRLPALFEIPPQLAPVQCDSLDACHLDGPYALWYYPISLCEGSETSFCCPGLLDASVMVLLERQLGVHPDADSVSPFC